MTFSSWQDVQRKEYVFHGTIPFDAVARLHLTKKEHELYFGVPGSDGDELPMGTRLRLWAELMDRLDELHTVGNQ